MIMREENVKNFKRFRFSGRTGRLPTADWMLNLQILTSGGLQCVAETLHH
jgi:hypothetical protein